MTTNLPETEILKVDARGRVRVKAHRREGILDEFEKSGASAVSFAKIIGVKYQTFAGWVQKRKKACKEGEVLPAQQRVKHSLGFAEAVVMGDGPEKAILTIELPCGARIKLSGPEQVELVCHLLARLAKKENSLC